MSPLVCIVPFSLFAAVFLLHVVLWRLFQPKQHIGWMLGVFVLLPLPALAVLAAQLASSWQEAVLFALGFYSLAGIYVQTYPAIQAFSPSLRVILLIGRADGGLSLAQVQDALSGVELNLGRLGDLLTERFIAALPDGRVVLTPKGRTLAWIFVAYRSFLRLPPGKG